MKPVTAAVAAVVIAAIPAAPIRAHSPGDHHETFSAGEPGDPKKQSRTIEIEMTEMAFTPFKLAVKRGEQIRFVIANAGKEAHEFLLATTAENLKHAEVMRKHPDMEHDDPNGVRVAPGKSAEIFWKFSKRGTFEYACLIPNHREYGMVGQVTVK
jgi:uncharacterized cupredoxin-like copper-binding protein